jgi:hypothetical protein
VSSDRRPGPFTRRLSTARDRTSCLQDVRSAFKSAFHPMPCPTPSAKPKPTDQRKPHSRHAARSRYRSSLNCLVPTEQPPPDLAPPVATPSERGSSSGAKLASPPVPAAGAPKDSSAPPRPRSAHTGPGDDSDESPGRHCNGDAMEQVATGRPTPDLGISAEAGSDMRGLSANGKGAQKAAAPVALPAAALGATPAEPAEATQWSATAAWPPSKSMPGHAAEEVKWNRAAYIAASAERVKDRKERLWEAQREVETRSGQACADCSEMKREAEVCVRAAYYGGPGCDLFAAGPSTWREQQGHRGACRRVSWCDQ